MASSPYGGGGFGYQQPGGLGGGTPLGGGAPGSLLGGDRYGGTPLTGGHGAMGSGNRYGGSLLAGDRAGGYQSSGLGAGGLMGSAGGHNQHGGSYGDLGGAPGSGIGRSQQPFAPMLFASPGGSALGGRVGGGYDPSALGSPAHGGLGGAANGGAGGFGGARASTAGYFTGGAANGGAVHTPGSHGLDRRGSFFGAGERTPMTSGGRRVFGGGASGAEPRTSDGDRGTPNTGGSLRGGSKTLDSGHVGTPWGDKNAGGGGGGAGANRSPRSPGRGGAAPINPSLDPEDDDENGGAMQDAWVTVFGFPPGELTAVLSAFQRDGDVMTHDSFSEGSEGSESVNWVHVRFASRGGAQRALRRNGTMVARCMVGVRRLGPDDRAHVERAYGGEGLGVNHADGVGGKRIVRPAPGGFAPGARPSRFQPSREGIALQPRRSWWNNFVEFVFGL